MGQNEECKLLCQTEAIPKEDAEFINQCIAQDYAINWVVDGLPAAHVEKDEHTQEEYYNIGFALGFANGGKAALNNHYKIVAYYHERSDNTRRVVGVVVHPASKDTKLKPDGTADCKKENLAFYLKGDGTDKVVYTYDIEWVVSSHFGSVRDDDIYLVYE